MRSKQRKFLRYLPQLLSAPVEILLGLVELEDLLRDFDRLFLLA
jgi:hypothetical protein